MTTDDPPVRMRPEIAAAPPYRQGAPAGPGAFALASNESPFDPLPGVLAAFRAADRINRYPRMAVARLRERLAGRFGVSSEAVHVSAGTTATLLELMLAVASSGDEIVFAWRSFEAYPLLARVAGAVPVTVPLAADGRNDLDAMAAAVTDRTRAVFVCSPNNPTGPVVAHAEFVRFLGQIPSDVLVVLDEAYREFVTDPAAVDGARLLDRPNVVALRTFSKAYGLAGLRIGYALGHQRVLAGARITAIPLAVTAEAESAALASLDAEEELRRRVEAVTERRDRLASALRDLGWAVPDAQGNFVWLAAGDGTAAGTAAFAAAGVIVRPLGEGIRVSIGEEESIERILRVAASLLKGRGSR